MKPYCASINYNYDALYEYLINLPTLHLISGYALEQDNGASCGVFVCKVCISIHNMHVSY